MVNLDFLNSQKEVTYHVEDFKGWHEEEQFTGDIWNGGKYKWKIEGLKVIIQQLQPKVIFETGFNVGHVYIDLGMAYRNGFSANSMKGFDFSITTSIR